MEAATLNGFKEPHYKQKWGTKARQGRDMHVTWGAQLKSIRQFPGL